MTNPALSTDLLENWMEIAWRAASDGVDRGEYPFGAAVCSCDGRIVAVATNTVVSTNNATAHGEVNAIKLAGQTLKRPNLSGHWLLSTAEPCPMCLSAAVSAGIRHIAFGASQAIITRAGYGHLGVTGQELADNVSSDMEIRKGILQKQCVALLLDHPKSSF